MICASLCVCLCLFICNRDNNSAPGHQFFSLLRLDLWRQCRGQIELVTVPFRSLGGLAVILIDYIASSCNACLAICPYSALHDTQLTLWPGLCIYSKPTVYLISTVLYKHTNISKYAAMDALMQFYWYNHF